MSTAAAVHPSVYVLLGCPGAGKGTLPKQLNPKDMTIFQREISQEKNLEIKLSLDSSIKGNSQQNPVASIIQLLYTNANKDWMGLVNRENSLHHNPWVVGSSPTAAIPPNLIDKTSQNLLKKFFGFRSIFARLGESKIKSDNK